MMIWEKVALGGVLHERVEQHERNHGLDDGHGAGQHAGVVPALAPQQHLITCRHSTDSDERRDDNTLNWYNTNE